MSKYRPAISVVIPVYNGAVTIGACLESLLNQNYPAEAYEIIVVENGSTDNTTQIVEQYPVRLFHSDLHGPAAARNLGVAQSHADIVAFTDADCIAHSHWLSELVKPYADPEVGGVGGAIVAYDHAHRDTVERFSEEISPLVNFISGAHEFLPHFYTANASYRRSLLNQIGGFNPKLITGQDVDLSWRLQLRTLAKICYAPEAIIYHHHRTTRTGLARQYRRYGFGEIVLDTIYGKYPGYPRNLKFQAWRMLGQLAALPRYAFSTGLRQFQLATGRATRYEAAIPQLWFLIESSNLWGKLEGLIATRLMTDAHPALSMEAEALVSRLFPSGKA